MSQLESPSAYLRVAAAQAAAAPGDLAANARAAAVLVDRAEHGGADLVVLPELFLPGYHPPTLEASPDRCDVEADGRRAVADPRLDPLRDIAQRHRLCVLVGASVRQGPRRHISTLLVDRLGRVRDVYRKQHLCDAHERDLFTAGDAGATVVLKGWRLGMGICYDAAFPEHARAAAKSGCHAYVTAGAFRRGGEHRRDVYHAARALDNTFYTVLSSAVDGPEPWTFGGGSAIYDPEGRPVDRAPDRGSGLAAADLESRKVEETREAHTMLADVRADLTERITVDIEG
ncbi:MAG: carbon-nitrogen hydrolase family protein [Stackebrandtia sp.]